MFMDSSSSKEEPVDELLNAKRNQPSAEERIRMCIEAMEKRGLNPGQVFEVAFFENVLMVKHHETQFSFLMIGVCFKLETVYGRPLTAASHQGKAWHIRPSREHVDVMQKRRRRVRSGLIRNCLLAQVTKVEELTDDEKRKLESEKNHSSFDLAALIRADNDKRKNLGI